MTPRLVHLVSTDPDRPDLAALAVALRASGYSVTLTTEPPPPGAGLVLHADPPQRNGLALDVAESRHIARVLAHTGGNRRQAALLLGIARSTLLAKIRKYGL